MSSRLSKDVLGAENDAGKSTMDGPLPFGGNSVPGPLIHMRNPR
jgi:hypothetical protein